MIPFLLIFWFISAIAGLVTFIVLLNSIDRHLDIPFSWFALFTMAGIPIVILFSPIVLPVVYICWLYKDYPRFIKAIKGTND